MLSEDELVRYIESREIHVAGSVIEDAAGSASYLVFVKVIRDSDNKQVPSNRKLHLVREKLASEGTPVEFMLKDAYASDVEAGLRASLLHSFIESIRNVFMSVVSSSAHVWIEQKHQLTDAELDEMKSKTVRYLQEFDLSLMTFKTTVDENFPTKFACLKAVRQFAPITVAALSQRLELAGFSVPSLDWLSRRLDSIRRSGQLVWTDGGAYVMSLKGIRALGTKKNRQSPDLARLLALARRGG